LKIIRLTFDNLRGANSPADTAIAPPGRSYEVVFAEETLRQHLGHGSLGKKQSIVGFFRFQTRHGAFRGGLGR
jgi:hypothetical protein